MPINAGVLTIVVVTRGQVQVQVIHLCLLAVVMIMLTPVITRRSWDKGVVSWVGRPALQCAWTPQEHIH